MAATTNTRDIAAEMAYLTRALKAPTLRDAVERLAPRARDESWSHEEFLIACLQREVSARESHGGEGRIRAARFPSRKSLEEFDFDRPRPETRPGRPPRHPRFRTAKDNVLLLGPPGTGKAFDPASDRGRGDRVVVARDPDVVVMRQLSEARHPTTGATGRG